MVSMMDMEATNEICDNRPILPHSAVSQRSIEIQIQPRSPTIKETIVQIPLKPIKSSSDSSPTTEAASTTTPTATADVKKRNLKLDLKTPSIEESGSGGGGEGGSGCDGDTTTSRSSRRNDNSTSDNENGSAKQRHDSASSSGSVEDENAKNNNEIRSPMSPRSPGNQGRFGSRMIPHQNSLTSSIDVSDERRALRDALYQGIFSRHRRTIFAMGSFLRMLKSKNSQYNSIRSSSEGEGEGEEEPR